MPAFLTTGRIDPVPLLIQVASPGDFVLHTITFLLANEALETR